jgi:hypothetical protein
MAAVVEKFREFCRVFGAANQFGREIDAMDEDTRERALAFELRAWSGRIGDGGRRGGLSHLRLICR